MNIQEYLNCSKPVTFNQTLFDYIDRTDKKDAEIYKRADVDRKLFSKIRCNENYIPRRETIIKLSLALQLKKQDTLKLLNSAGYCLSDSTFDRVISYCIENGVYDINQVNNYLYTHCNATLK